MQEIKYLPLTEVLETIVDNRGKTVPTSDSGIKLIATNCISNNNLFPVYEKIRYVSKETYDNWFRSHLQPGDIIFVNKGGPGKVCMVPEKLDFCIAQDMVGLRVDSKIIYNKFLFAYLRSPIVQRFIESNIVGSLIPHFKKEQFKSIMIPILPMEKQKKIGDFYYKLCYKEELNNSINENIYKIGDYLYNEYFGKYINDLPEGYRIVKMGEVITNYDSKRKPMSKREREQHKGPYPYYGATSVIDNVDDYLFDDTLLLMGEDGTVKTDDGYPVLQYIWGKNWINNHAHVLKGDKISTELLLFALRKTNVENLITGAVQLKINQENMNKIEFVIGPDNKNRELEKILLDLMKKSKNIIEENVYLKQLRELILPKFISGEINVDEI